MTIKMRNAFFLSLFAFSSATLLSAVALLFYSIHEKLLTPPPSFPVFHGLHFLMASYSFSATLALIFFLIVFVIAAIIYLYIEFEKTQSIEIIFFSLFLLGLLGEAARLAIPFFNLWGTLSNVIFVIGRITLFSRIIAPAALLFAAVMSEAQRRENIESNIFMLIILSLWLSFLIPLNTARILPNFCVDWGTRKAFFIIRMLVLLSSALSIFVVANQTGKGEWGFFLLIAGYAFTEGAMSIFFVSVASFLLAFGTALYLTSLHKRYLWQ